MHDEDKELFFGFNGILGLSLDIDTDMYPNKSVHSIIVSVFKSSSTACLKNRILVSVVSRKNENFLKFL